VPSPEWKRERASSARSRLLQWQSELAYTRDEIEDVKRVTDGNGSEEDRDSEEHLKSLEERAAQLEQDIAEQIRRVELFEEEKAWVPGDTRNMAIGQGNVLATPLQMTNLVAAIANGGELLQPHLVADHSDDFLRRRLPLQSATLDVIRNAMREVVFGRQGTARQEGLRRHRAAAKTGTAEIGANLNNGWLIGFAPYDKPRIAFAVVAERTELHGGDIAGPVTAKILDAYFGKNEKKEKK